MIIMVIFRAQVGTGCIKIGLVVFLLLINSCDIFRNNYVAASPGASVQDVPDYYYRTDPTVPNSRLHRNPYQIAPNNYQNDQDQEYVEPYYGGDSFMERKHEIIEEEKREAEHELIYE